jgi:hypothetical protein
MKKIKRVFVLFITGTMLVLDGCSNMPIHYGQIENYPASNNYRRIDDPVLDKELCTLIVAPSLTLRRVDGAGRTWSAPYSVSGCSLRIAAGDRTLMLDYSSSSSRTSMDGEWILTTTYSAEDLNITYEFEPGRTYRVYPVRNIAEKSVTIEIEETAFPVQLGWRMGPYLGWQQGGMANAPMAGLFAIAQAGIAVTADDIFMEFLAEANAGFGYSPFKKESSVYEDENSNDFVDTVDFNGQAGGTVNFYFGKSRKKTGLGIGGGVGVGTDNDLGPTHIPYLRASFFPYSGDFWEHIRLFVDYSFTQEDAWKRFGLGVIFFL